MKECIAWKLIKGEIVPVYNIGWEMKNGSIIPVYEINGQTVYSY